MKLSNTDDLEKMKENGIHYTPPALASFLADSIINYLNPKSETISVLDPACGNGALLNAFALSLPKSLRKKLMLHGYENDQIAGELARASLEKIGASGVTIHNADFLEMSEFCDTALPLFDFDNVRKPQKYDVVIANPPYVRTQILGAKKAQDLARQFGLNGRVDLYHAFIRAMGVTLKPNGVLGLLTSNRFLYIQSGASIREYLLSKLDLKAIYDLGDTKLFSAAVLPVIVVAQNSERKNAQKCLFHRTYAFRNGNGHSKQNGSKFSSVLEGLRSSAQGVITTPNGKFVIEKGLLAESQNVSAPWVLSTPRTDSWLSKIETSKQCVFDDVSTVKVGVKTTADEVFIIEDPDNLHDDMRPEAELLLPLITHEDIAQWVVSKNQKRKILYPHIEHNGKRFPVDLGKYPFAKAYLEHHYARLAGRHYVIESGRQWYEIWVPHKPSLWSKNKIIFPDISEEPRFSLDETGAIINGDCYWITLRGEEDKTLLYIMLAVANSSFTCAFYDAFCHNKLYSGRRRFMTQYVKTFPLPRFSVATDNICKLVPEVMLRRKKEKGCFELERELDDEVWRSFGLRKKVVG